LGRQAEKVSDVFRLNDNSRVAVIGGGPAGSLFAIHLLSYADKAGIHPQIRIYQERNFDQPGPLGCKGCAGILSLSVVRTLAELGLVIPEIVARSRIDEYAVHSAYTTISIGTPDKTSQITSVYRGNGPRVSQFDPSISFDGWLIEEAQELGAIIERHRVSRIELGIRPVVETQDGEANFDLVVLASGANGRPIRIRGHNYVPPQVRVMAQDELAADPGEIRSALSNRAHAFLIPQSGIIFGSLVPKGEFVNVSVLGNGKFPVSVTDFLNNEMVKKVLPIDYRRVCGCHPKAVVGPARNYYSDRFVALGDAATTRLYKDGIFSSLVTAREAARTVVDHGFSRRDFETHYAPHCKTIITDNRWGSLLFKVNDRLKESRALVMTEHRILASEQDRKSKDHPFTMAAWGMFTGNYNYRTIARTLFSPGAMLRFMALASFEKAKSIVAGKETQPRQLHVGSRKVLILGSGFGGSYVLRKIVPELNRNENVETTMVSDENFMLFSPMLHEVAMGSIETRHIAYPIRRLHWRDRFNFVNAEVEQIDLSKRTVITSLGTLNFDYLVLALGSVSNLSGAEAAGNNVFTLKTLKDSMLIRNHIIEVFERASVEMDSEKQRQLLTFVVAGAGYTGVQLVTEMHDFVLKGLPRFYRSVNRSNIRIILVEAAPKIISELHTKLGAYTMRHLQNSGIEVRMKSRVTSTSDDNIEISNGTETEVVPCSTLIWTVGVRANPRIAELTVEKDNIGRVYVNSLLEVRGAPGVYAVGDCARFEDPRTGQPAPPRAHIAVRQAKVAAHNILAEIRGQAPKQYHFTNDAEVLSLGSSQAVFRFRGLRLYGLLARFLWTAGYTLLITGNYNRTRVMLDWILTGLFGRDTVLVKLTKQ
jgi:NADH dehydrogenase